MTDKLERILLMSWDATSPITHDRSGYGHVEFAFHYLHEDGKPRNFRGDRYEVTEQGDCMADLVMRSQVNLKPDEVLLGKELYGWGIAYRRPFDVDMYRARGMAKTLGKIHRYLDKQIEKYDYPETYAIFVQRIAYCMKVTAILTESGKALSSDNYMRRTYQKSEVGDLRYNIDNLMARHQDVQN